MEHPGYRAAWLNLTAHVRRLAEGPDRRLIGDGGLGREQRAGLTVDYMLACNGVRKHRTADVLMLTAPPLVRFANRGQWILQTCSRPRLTSRSIPAASTSRWCVASSSQA